MLADYEIRELIERHGAVNPYDPNLVNPASLDVRVGFSLIRENAYGPGNQSELVEISLRAYSEDNPYYLPPGGWILVDTLEMFFLPDTVAAEFKLKSSRAREGWGHSLAGHCDPGWHGSKLTMELKNYRQHQSLPIYPGLRMGQLIFYPCNAPERHYGTTGRYNGDRKVSASKDQ